jgi:hypothetical protein
MSQNVTFPANISATQFNGALSGNASTATALATARNIALTGAVTGNANFDGSGNISIATTATSDPVITLTGAVTGSGTMTNLGNVSITTTATADPTLTLAGDASGSATFTNLGNATLTVTVADDSHNHIISNVDGLQTALDGKSATSHNHSIEDLIGVGISSPATGQVLKWSGIAWTNQADTNTDTNTVTSIRRDNTGTYRTGNINLVGGTNVTISETSAGVFSFSATDTNTVYTHPTHPGDDIDIDTGALSGATVISDLDFNITTDTLGHVTDANATVATRTLTLANLGYTGATNANYITNNNQLTNGAGYVTSSHGHSADVIGVGGISFIGKSTTGAGTTAELSVATAQTMLGLGSAAYVATSTFAAASHNHAASSINSGTMATARLASGTASSSTYLRGDSTWATIPGGGIAADDTEWYYVGKSTDSSANTTITVDSTDLGSSYDWVNYDYKFVYQGSTSAEDTSTVTIYFDGDTTTADKYSYQHHKVTQTAETTETEALVGDSKSSGSIDTGLALSSFSSGGYGTDVELEFTVRRSLTTASGLYGFLVRGEGNVHYWPTTQNLITANDGMAQTRFVGSYRQDGAIASVTINHGITVGGTDVNIVRVYRRRKT